MVTRTFSSIADTANTRELIKNLRSNSNDIVITSVQKLQRLVRKKNFTAPDKRILFIVDEAHRSTGGEVFREIQKNSNALPGLVIQEHRSLMIRKENSKLQTSLVNAFMIIRFEMRLLITMFSVLMSILKQPLKKKLFGINIFLISIADRILTGLKSRSKKRSITLRKMTLTITLMPASTTIIQPM